MEIEILLLKEAIKQYEKGTVAVGDYALKLVYEIRMGKPISDSPLIRKD